MEDQILYPTQAQLAVSVPAMNRVAIEAVEPEIDAGRFPIKRTVGERVVVEADIFADGHEVLAAALLYRASDEAAWSEAPMRLLDNDRWRGEFQITRLESFLYTVQGWVDAIQTWACDFLKKYDAGQDVAVDARIGAELVGSAARRARGTDSEKLAQLAIELAIRNGEALTATIRSAELAELMTRYPDRAGASTYPAELRVIVDRPRARFSTWYEMFPRSCTTDTAHHGTFLDCIERLDYVATMGFDVLYLPPIHPIGRKGRKGRNNSLPPSSGDVGSPWAIGSAEVPPSPRRHHPVRGKSSQKI